MDENKQKEPLKDAISLFIAFDLKYLKLLYIVCLTINFAIKFRCLRWNAGIIINFNHIDLNFNINSNDSQRPHNSIDDF